MTALRRRKILATLLKLTRGPRASRSLAVGPGCTCESCVQAWDRHHERIVHTPRESRRLRLGLY
jgi:hypothetical protein